MYDLKMANHHEYLLINFKPTMTIFISIRKTKNFGKKFKNLKIGGKKFKSKLSDKVFEILNPNHDRSEKQF